MYVQAIVEELKDKVVLSNYSASTKPDVPIAISTVYLGGGTPSQLSVEQISAILQTIRQHYCLMPDAEITMEANPGDLSLDMLTNLRQTGVNRLSLGIQSFHDDQLRLIGRRHDAQQAIQAVHMAQQAGFDNLSIDLIYGLPGQTMEIWTEDINMALSLDVQHISAYCLSYEEGTRMSQMRNSGQIAEMDEDLQLQMYDTLVDRLTQEGFLHYEVSNFAKPGHHSRHNSSYWNDTPYIGIGAGAHAYDGQTRSWWIGNLQDYIQQSLAHQLQYESERLTPADRVNERIMLSLRTANGLELSTLEPDEQTRCLSTAQPYIEQQLLTLTDGHLRATLQGIHILNRIIEDLMI